MQDKSNWDWDIGKREIADMGALKSTYDYVEEPYVSPNGEKIAAVIRTEDMEFGVWQNGEIWESTFDKVYNLRFTPDNRLAGLVSEMAEWTVAIDGQAWENKAEFAWNMKFSNDGKDVAIAAQSERKYFAIINDKPWENSYEALSDLALSPVGHRTAGVVQIDTFGESEIFKFQEGCYSVAVDGKAWDRKFVGAWEPVFSSDFMRVAAQVRTTLYDYTIAVDGQTWDQLYLQVWEPAFSPADGSVTAAVRSGGAWSLAKDGNPFWNNKYAQLWHHTYSPDAKRIAAIVSTKYGRWTIAVDDSPWSHTYGDLVTDITFSPDGSRVACVGKQDSRWTICANGQSWDLAYDMAWKPVFSPDSAKVAAKVEQSGKYLILIDGKPIAGEYQALWDPIFSPDGDKLLIRGIPAGEDNKYYREVISLTDR